MASELYLPTLSHWEHGNPWTGSWGPKARLYIVPQAGQINVQMWEGPLCRTLAQLEEPVQFPISEEGIEQVRTWLLAQCARINGEDGP